MKLNRLKIENFLGIRSADLDLADPVHIFLGDNGAGKSSVRDAIKFVFDGTVESRGYTKKNQAPLMGSNGKLKVELSTDQGEFARTATTGTKSPAELIDILPILIEPQSVLRMKPADRQAVFGSVFRQTETSDKITELLRHQGFTQPIIDRCVADLDDAQAWAVEQRVLAKRKLKDLEEARRHAPSSVVDIGGNSVDLLKYNAADIDTMYGERAAARDKIMGELQRIGEEPPDTKDSLKVIGQLEKTLADLTDKNLLEDRDEARLAVEKAQTNFIKKRDKAAAAGATVLTTTMAIRDCYDMKTGCPCPTCGQAVKENIKASMLERLEGTQKLTIADKGLADKAVSKAIKESDAVKTKLDGIIKKLDETAVSRKAVEDDIKAVTQQITDAAQYEPLKGQLVDIDRKIANIRGLKEGFAAYAGQAEAIAHGDHQRNEAVTTIASMDSLDALLKPDGAVRQAANDDMESIRFDADLQKAWLMPTLKLNPDGTITLTGRPIEAASTSEQYRAGILLAELLARSLGVGLLILDGVDVLSSETRRPLFDAVRRWKETFGTIMMLSTSTARPLNAVRGMYPGVVYHWVENGAVERI